MEALKWVKQKSEKYGARIQLNRESKNILKKYKITKNLFNK